MSAALEAHYQQTVTTIAQGLKVIVTKRQPRIVDISRANPGVFTTLWDHGMVDGEIRRPMNVRGMVEVNENFYQVTVVGPRQFSIDADTTSFTPFQKGVSYGVAQKVIGFTNDGDSVTLDRVVYVPQYGADGSAISITSDMSQANLELTGLISETGPFNRKDLLEGLFAFAEYEFFEFNYVDLTMGKAILPTGNFGEITVNENSFKVELLGLMDRLYQETGRKVSIACPAELGDKVIEPLDDRFGCKVRLIPPEWLPLSNYTTPAEPHDAALGSLVKPSVFNGKYLKCTQAGTSGASEPDSSGAIGDTVVDGTVEWTLVEAWVKYSTVTDVADRRTFADSARRERSGWFDYGLVTFITGDNKGWASEVKTHLRTSYPILAVNTGAKTFEISGDQTAFFTAGDIFSIAGSTGNDADDYELVSATFSSMTNRTTITVTNTIPSAVADGHIDWLPGQILLRDKAFNDIQAADEYEIQKGCNKFRDICIDDFDNIRNFRGHPYVPGFHVANFYPDAPQ